MHGDFFPMAVIVLRLFHQFWKKNLHLKKMGFFKENCKRQAKCDIEMTRKYPFFTQIANIAQFWNSVGPNYSPKKLQTKNVA